jgi:cobalt-zinc-cadmium efflux system outer membrane protein
VVLCLAAGAFPQGAQSFKFFISGAMFMLTKVLQFLAIISISAISGCTDHDNDIVQAPKKPVATTQYAPETAEPNGVITLRQALALALMHNPELRVFSWQVRASEARTLQASLLPNPEIGVRMEEIGGTGELSGFHGAETTIQLGQLIELAGKPSKRKQVASLESKLAGWDYEAKRLDVLTEVAHAFVEVLATQKKLILTDELVQLSDQIFNTVTQRVEAGKDSPIEKTKAQVALASARIEEKQARQHLESARKRLATTWGSMSPVFESATGLLEVTFPIPSESELRRLLSQNPDLVRWAVEVERGQAVLELEKAKAIPDITLSGGMRRFNETDDNAVVFGVAIPLPVSNRNQGRILEAGYNLTKVQTQRSAIEARLYAALTDAHQAISSASIEVTGLKNDVLPGAQSALNASRQGYREGKFDYLVVLDAQRTFFQVRARYIQALAAYHKAKADVERLIGQDLDSVENPLEGKAQERK